MNATSTQTTAQTARRASRTRNSGWAIRIGGKGSTVVHNTRKARKMIQARMAAAIARFEDQEMFSYADATMGWM